MTLDVRETFAELGVGPAQSLLRIHLQKTRQIDQDEKQVADFILQRRNLTTRNSFLDLSRKAEVSMRLESALLFGGLVVVPVGAILAEPQAVLRIHVTAAR